MCEIYNNKNEMLTDIIYKIEEKDGKYCGEIKISDYDAIEFEDFFATEKEIFFIKNNKVIQRKEYFFNDNNLIIENNVFTKE